MAHISNPVARAADQATVGAITASAQSMTQDLREYSGVLVYWYGTFAGITLAFEATYDGGTNWVAVGATPTSSGAAITSITTTTNTPGAYEVFSPGADKVRIRATAYTSGTLNVRLIPIQDAKETVVAVAGGTITLSSGTNLAADVGVAVRATSGGIASVVRLLSAAATTNSTLVKGSAGRIYRIRGYNASASVKYLKLYNKATAPTVGTDTPTETIVLKASDTFDIDFEGLGRYYSTGIGFGITGAVTDTDTTALTAADIVGMNVWYA